MTTRRVIIFLYFYCVHKFREFVINPLTVFSLQITVMKITSYFIASLLTLCLFSCARNEPAPLDLPPVLVPISDLPYGSYLQTFNEKALSKGLDFSKELRELTIDVIPNHAENSVCNNTILLTEDYEILFRENYIEQIIYHQIAHCLLSREHRDDLLPNGEWASVMRTNPQMANDAQSIDFTAQKREYYLEELFNEEADPADYFNPNPLPFEPNIERDLLQKLDCGVDYENLIPAEINAEISVKFSIDEPLQDMAIYLFKKDNEYMKLWFNPVYNDFVFRDSQYGKRYQVDIDNFEPVNDELRFSIRRIGDYYSYFLNEQYIFSHYEEAAVIEDVKSGSNAQVGCGPEIKVYEIL